MVKAKTGTDVQLDEWLPGHFLGCESAGEGDFGPMLRWRFELEEGTRSVLTSEKWTARAKASKLYFGLLGIPYSAGLDIDTDELAGMACFVMYEGDAEKASISKAKAGDDKTKPLSKEKVKELNLEEDARWEDREEAF